MDILKPTFGDTKSYQQIREFSDTMVSGLKYFSKFAYKETEVNPASENGVVKEYGNGGERKLNTKDLNNNIGTLSEELESSSIDVFNL